ncbi:MAG: 50S ribosomal protein L21 [Acidobacteria bacterium]|nr:MAG: 50S ribosomal protein L21 [Acidobacteriota bacterium]
MYAIVHTGGRQVKMTPGALVTVDRLGQDAGAEVTFDQVLLVATDGGDVVAGSPLVANARVVGVVDGEARGPKIRVFMKKRRKGSRRTLGHRSRLTRVRVREILV